MTALVRDRNTPRAEGDMREGPVAAATLIYAGAMVMRNAAGFLLEGQTATGLVGAGRAEERKDNSAGADGAMNVVFRTGTFHYANSAGADEVTAADIGTVCYAVDDQTVARTSGANTRSKAGIVDDVDANGVWVRFDAALTTAA